MKEYRYLVDKFAFQTPTQIEEAEKESEAIAYIRENSDLTNPKQVMALYMKLNEKPSFRTQIGLEFMGELYDLIVRSGKIERENVPGIKVDTGNPFRLEPSLDENEAKKRNTAAEHKLNQMKNKHRNLWIVNLFLIGVILVMFYIARNGDYSFISDYETKLVDKYAAWEEELSQREQALREKEVTDQ